MKGKEIVGVGMLFCKGWREIRGEMRKKKLVIEVKLNAH
jgi:hypothetical protein